jgi:DNA repair exonuclease SbcCD nuclease subunit
MTTVLFIGDPHIQVSNIPEVDLFMEKIINLATEKNPDIIIIAGDLLHTHERLHTIALNKAYELVNNMRLISKTYVLVGNHDYIQNQQFLTENHWMNGLKEWNNTIIVDKVMKENIKGEEFVFVPYVPPGRFQDALNTLNYEWKNVSCIFAHQEFFGCKMGAIVSVEGDKWPLDYPNVISGHIHSRQSPQKNIYYSGSAMQHAFGESEKNIIACLTFKNKIYENEEIDLKLPRKKIIYMGVENIDDFKIPNTEDKIKVTLKGNYEEFKSIKKTKKYKELLENNIKVVFKPNKKASIIDEINDINTKDSSFNKILNTIVDKEKDSYLSEVYELIINNNKIKHSDIIFL